MAWIPQCATVLLVVSLACAPAHVVTTPAPTPMSGSSIRYALRSDTSEFVAARMVSVSADRLIVDRFVPEHPFGRWVTDSVKTDSIAQLQVQVGKRANAGRGALIGVGVGTALGLLCASDEDAGEWATPGFGECMFGGIITGAGTGLLIGALRKSDVWAPTALPQREPELPPETPPPISGAPIGIGLRVPIRLPAP
jgi:hypothetical protein